MNQAYFTFCCSGKGKSVSGLGGDRARAAVKGTSEHELTVFKPYCSFPQYSSSSKTVFNPETAANAVSMAKLVYSPVGANESSQRFLAHSVYALPDKETLRDGNYFSHLIYPLPDAWSIRTALEMWRSPFWVTQDSGEISSQLPPVDENNIPFGIINENSFVEFLRSTPERQKKFLFLLKSFLTLNPNGKIVLTGYPEDMAFCLWGITRILPPPMWRYISFSTLEKPTLSCSFDVVNFLMPEKPESQDEFIFSELSKRQNVLFYSENPVFPSSAIPDIPLANEILEISVNGKFRLLDEFYQTVPVTWRKSSAALQLFWKFINRPKQITCNDISGALKIQELKSQAIQTLMDNSRFSLDEQLEFYSLLDAQRQDALLNRLISENSIEQIRNNEKYSKLLASALSIPEKSNVPDKKPSLFQRFFR